MKLISPQAIIFDWDNTLVDTWPIIHTALNATFEKWGMPLWTMQDTMARVHKSMRDSFPEVFGPNWQEAGAFYQQQYRDHQLELQPLPLAADVLAQVRRMGIFCVVVSNKKGVNLRKEIEHLEWGGYFDNAVGADDAARDKPHAEPVLLAFDKSHIRPGRDVWFIGDSAIDLECALATGCTAILYGESARDHPEYSATHYRGFPYHAHAHDHKQTLELLRG